MLACAADAPPAAQLLTRLPPDSSRKLCVGQPAWALGPPATLLGASQAGSGIAHVDGLPVPSEEGELPQVAGLNADMASGAEDEEIGNAEMVLAADRQSLQLQVVKTTEEAAQVGQRMSPAPPPPPPPLPPPHTLRFCSA